MVLGLVAVGAIGFFGAGRTWVSTTVSAEGVRDDIAVVTGTDINPLIGALALVTAAAGLGVLAAGRRLRRVIGVLVVIAAVAGLIVGVFADHTGALALAVEESPAFIGDNRPTPEDLTIWPSLSAVCFVLAAMLGALTVAAAGSWPTMSRRYERSGTAPADEERSAWDILNQGQDPTV